MHIGVTRGTGAMLRSGHIRSLRQHRRNGALPFLHWHDSLPPKKRGPVRLPPRSFVQRCMEAIVLGCAFLYRGILYFSFFDSAAQTPHKCHCIGSLWFAVSVRVRHNRRRSKTVCLKSGLFFTLNPFGSQPNIELLILSENSF